MYGEVLFESAQRNGDFMAWSGRECQDFDLFLQQRCALPAALLMENAAAALAEYIVEICETQRLRRVLLVAGPGNNGGDVLTAARHLHLHPAIDIALVAPLGLPPPPPASDQENLLQYPAWASYQALTKLNVDVQCGSVTDALHADPHLLVDGLFGVGLSRPLQETALTTVRQLNQHPAPILAVDVPSGLDCDTGLPLGEAVQARWTLSFVAIKNGFLLQQGPTCCGHIAVAGIGVSEGLAKRWWQQQQSKEKSRKK